MVDWLTNMLLNQYRKIYGIALVFFFFGRMIELGLLVKICGLLGGEGGVVVGRGDARDGWNRKSLFLFNIHCQVPLTLSVLVSDMKTELRGILKAEAAT